MYLVQNTRLERPVFSAQRRSGQTRVPARKDLRGIWSISSILRRLPTTAAARFMVSSCTLALSGSNRRSSCERLVCMRFAISTLLRCWLSIACWSCHASTPFDCDLPCFVKVALLLPHPTLHHQPPYELLRRQLLTEQRALPADGGKAPWGQGVQAGQMSREQLRHLGEAGLAGAGQPASRNGSADGEDARAVSERLGHAASPASPRTGPAAHSNPRPAPDLDAVRALANPNGARPRPVGPLPEAAGVRGADGARHTPQGGRHGPQAARLMARIGFGIGLPSRSRFPRARSRPWFTDGLSFRYACELRGRLPLCPAEARFTPQIQPLVSP